MGKLSREELRIYEGHVYYGGERCSLCSRTPEGVARETGRPSQRLSFIYVDGNDSNLSFHNTHLLCEPCRRARGKTESQPRRNEQIQDAVWPVDGADTVKTVPSIGTQESHDDGTLLTSGPDNRDRKGGYVCVYEENSQYDIDDEIDRSGGTSEMRAAGILKDRFQKWLCKTITERGPVSKRALIPAGAKAIKASSVTVSRYLEEEISFEGNYLQTKDERGITVIRFRPSTKPSGHDGRCVEDDKPGDLGDRT